MKSIQTACLFIMTLFYSMATFSQVTLEDIKQRGKLIIGTTGSQSPYSMVAKDSNLIGLEIDLAHNLADAMGVELEFKLMPFEELLLSVEKGEIDGAMSGITMTAARNMNVVFIGPYSITGKSLVTTKSVVKKLNKNREEELSKLRFVVLKGSNSLDFVKKKFPSSEFIEVVSHEKGVEMVENKDADALVADYEVCVLSVFKSDNPNLRSLADPLSLSMEPIGMALGSTDIRLINLIENHFIARDISGELELIENKWFEEGNWIDKVILE